MEYNINQEVNMKSTLTYQEKPWLSSYESGISEKISFENACIPDFLERSATQFPDHPALLFQGYRMNYRELNETVNRFASCLSGFGVKKGDSVAILLPNVIPCVIAYYATLKIGGIVVMNNPLYSDRELHHQFNDSGAKILVTLDLLGNRMIDLRPKTKIKQIVITSIGDYLPFPKNLLFPLVGKKKGLAADVKPAENVFKWKKVLNDASVNTPVVPLTFDDVAMYQYTGGTTGVSKGVMLTHANLSQQVQQIRAWFPGFNRGEEMMLGALPFFHVFGLSVAMNFAIYMGWGDILVPKPQPEPLLEAIGKFKPTFAPLVPTMYIGMLNHPNINQTDLSSIKGCFSGSAPLPIEVIREFEKKTGAVIVEGFGMTESTPVTHINPFGGKRKVGSIGIPIPNTEARIVDLSDGKTDMPVGESGELIIRGPQVMKGYLNKPEETEKTIIDGWLYTGDIAQMDSDGYFFIVDRKKDMIISGGLNVYPRDIEEVFYAHPKVQEATAIGVPHPTRGEAVKVYVVLKSGETATEKELMEYCKQNLATYKLPTSIEFRPELPKSNVGKILKKNLRDEQKAKG
jgi:long-chain acyl-CoA synthetase